MFYMMRFKNFIFHSPGEGWDRPSEERDGQGCSSSARVVSYLAINLVSIRVFIQDRATTILVVKSRLVQKITFS